MGSESESSSDSEGMVLGFFFFLLSGMADCAVLVIGFRMGMVSSSKRLISRLSAAGTRTSDLMRQSFGMEQLERSSFQRFLITLPAVSRRRSAGAPAPACWFGGTDFFSDVDAGIGAGVELTLFWVKRGWRIMASGFKLTLSCSGVRRVGVVSL